MLNPEYNIYRDQPTSRASPLRINALLSAAELLNILANTPDCRGEIGTQNLESLAFRLTSSTEQPRDVSEVHRDLHDDHPCGCHNNQPTY